MNQFFLNFRHEFSVFFGELLPFQKVRAVCHGAAEGFFPSPPGDVGMVAGQKNVRYFPSVVFCRFGVLGIFQDGS